MGNLLIYLNLYLNCKIALHFTVVKTLSAQNYLIGLDLIIYNLIDSKFETYFLFHSQCYPDDLSIIIAVRYFENYNSMKYFIDLMCGACFMDIVYHSFASLQGFRYCPMIFILYENCFFVS